MPVTPQFHFTQSSHFLRFVMSGALATSIFFAVGAASATTADTIEMQLDANEFGALIRQEVLDRVPCPSAISCSEAEIGVGPIPCRVDHLDAPVVGTFRFANEAETVDVGASDTLDGITPVEFVQPVAVYAKTEACILDASCGGNDYLRVLPADLVFRFSIDASESKPKLCAEVVDVEGPEVTNVERAVLQVAMGEAVCQDLPTGKLDKLVDGRVPRRAGVTLGTDGQDLAFRLEFPPAPIDDVFDPLDSAGWREFLNGNLAPSPSNDGLGLFLHKSHFISKIRKQLTPKKTEEEGAKQWLDLEEEVTWNWTPQGHSGARLDMVVPIEAIAIPYLCDAIDTDIISTTTFSFNAQTEELAIDLHVDTDMSFWDKTDCMSRITGGFSPTQFASNLKQEFLQLLMDTFKKTMRDRKMPNACTAVADDRAVCHYDVGLSTLYLRDTDFESPESTFVPGGIRRFEGIHGTDEGITVYGRFEAVNDSNPWFLESFEIPIFWGLTNSSCYSGGESEIFGGMVKFRGRGRVCQAEPSNDPHGLFRVSGDVGDLEARELAAEQAHKAEPEVNALDPMPRLPADYVVDVIKEADPNFGRTPVWTAPYPFEITVHTTVGSKTINLGTPVYDPDAAAAAEVALQMETFIDCQTFAEQGLDNLYGVETPDSVINPAESLISIGDEYGLDAPAYTSEETTYGTTAATTDRQTDFGSVNVRGTTATR